MFGLNRLRQILLPFKNHISSAEVIRRNEINKNILVTSFFATARNVTAEAPQSSVGGREAILSGNTELEITRDTIKQVNDQIKNGKEGRLFAVVHICGKQFKITSEDVIIIEGYWPPQIGDEIKLEKVLVVGGMDFTLVGRPILPKDLISVKATVVEKDLSHTKTVFYKKKRKQYTRINFYRSHFTMLRINEISVTGSINEHQSVTQYERI